MAAKSEKRCAMGGRSYCRETQSIDLVDTGQLWKHHFDCLHNYSRWWTSVWRRDSIAGLRMEFAVSLERPPTSSETSGRSDTSATSTVTQPWLSSVRTSNFEQIYVNLSLNILCYHMWCVLYCLPVCWVFVWEECGVCKIMSLLYHYCTYANESISVHPSCNKKLSQWL